MPVASQIFVNLPVRDLKRSVDFFTGLGFSFDPRFTDQNATCMIVGENMYAMLLVEKFFGGFTVKPVADAFKGSEVLVALSVDSRAKVDEICDRALASGGSANKGPQDHGWMYGRSFQDPDGHIWEVLFMDMSQLPPGQGRSAYTLITGHGDSRTSCSA
jgi:predicted lactoylglutathione lyase